MSVRVFIGLGANLGDAPSTLRQAGDALARLPGLADVRLSSLYRSPAWGRQDQPDFINAVAAADTSLTPTALLGALLAIERGFGRRRADDGSDRWGPRTLDLDLLLYGQQMVSLPALVVPHPCLHLRAFALVPLLELAPAALIPGVGQAADALALVDQAGIEALR